MGPPGLPHYLIVGAVLFAFGTYTVITRTNAVGILMGVELILNAANVNFVAFQRFNPSPLLTGQVFALFVIVLALHARERTGRGQQVDIGMLDGVVSLLTYHASMHLTTATMSQRVGNRHATIAPYDTFSAADGFKKIFNLWEDDRIRQSASSDELPPRELTLHREELAEGDTIVDGTSSKTYRTPDGRCVLCSFLPLRFFFQPRAF